MARPETALLSAIGLTKRFGPTLAVDTVSFELQSGEILALIGPSGCGKTTMLRLMNRLIEPDEGEVRLSGEAAHEVSPENWRRRIGYIIQSAGLFPHWSVEENVTVTPRLLGWDEARRHAAFEAQMRRVNMEPATFARRKPHQLSGGQAQRVGIARALAAEPDLVLMDEPFAALDAVTKSGLIDDLKALRRDIGFSAIMVTHDLSEALRLADRIAVMDRGRIVQIAPGRDLVSDPATALVRDLVESPRASAREVLAAFGGPEG